MMTRLSFKVHNTRSVLMMEHVHLMMTMRKKFIGTTLGAVAMLAHSAQAQSNTPTSVPLRELSAPEVQTLPQFASIASVRELSSGKVMVIDASRHQVVVFGHALAEPGGGNRFGNVATQRIRLMVHVARSTGGGFVDVRGSENEIADRAGRDREIFPSAEGAQSD
jgi:hypothetical protein